MSDSTVAGDYALRLTCACGNFGTVTDTGRSQAIRQANRRGWKISEGTKRCWCPACEPPKGEGPRRRR